MQNFARKHFIAIDKLQYDIVIKDNMTHQDVKEAPADGALVHGIYIEGCRWNYDKHMLDESEPKKLFTDVPMIHLQPIENRVVPEEGFYSCPIYKVLSRTGTLLTTGHSTNFVMDMEFPTEKDAAKWIKAGVAGFLALRY